MEVADGGIDRALVLDANAVVGLLMEQHIWRTEELGND